jgi:hypothetical protein
MSLGRTPWAGVVAAGLIVGLAACGGGDDTTTQPTGQACTGAGVAWSASAEGDPGACTVTYDTSGKYTLAASVDWTVKWWLAGAPQPDNAGPTNTATRPVTVLEIHTVNR